MKTLSVVLAVFNEEKTIRDCLESVKWANEIIVMDGESSDGTVKIVKEYTDKLFTAKNYPIFHINKNLAIEKASCDWVLQLDADERVSAKLKEEIIKTINSDTKDVAFYLPRKNFFLGRFLKKGGQYPDYVIRLFRRGKAHLPAKSVHEQMEVAGSVGKLRNDLIHLADPTFERYLMRSDRYTTLEAAFLLDKKMRPSLLNFLNYMLVKPMTTFLCLYIRHKGFLDGFPGFVFALYSGIHYPTSYVKFWEKYHEKNSH